MTDDTTFETETMAELCAKQGRLGEAVAIFRRLLETHPRAEARGRWTQRLETLERAWGMSPGQEITPAELALPAAPGVAVSANDDGVTVAWALPAEINAPALELFLIQKTPAGVETQKRAVTLTAAHGRIAFAVPALHTALAAVGRREGEQFVPLARARA